ncbi:hypothetical protein EA655_10555 [Pseudoxanthomonas winnipegensis]|uniref:Uncharacterized protein n=1 Tax=Pseudoxanthomonas winnipegensis TaxID=2480810 RepID=A0A4Q8M3J3_9GAMM|nr:hypothetical protein EA655_10555 [Pseudoxanthomonas winnipegensis]
MEGDGSIDPPDPVDPVIRGLRSTIGLEWQLAARHRVATVVRWGEAPALRPHADLLWAEAAGLRQSQGVEWGAAPRARAAGCMAWRGRMGRVGGRRDLRWLDLPVVSRSVDARWWGRLLRLDPSGAILWQADGLARLTRSFSWDGSPPRAGVATIGAWRSLRIFRRGARMPWGKAAQVPWIVLPPRPPQPPEPQPGFPPGNAVGLNLGCPIIGIAGFAPLNLGVTACYAVRPQRKTYIVLNTINVVRLPDRAPIAVESIEITGDKQSWGYSLQLTLADPSQLSLLKPTASGPRQLEVAINGYLWTFLAESYAVNREWGGGGVSVTGRSRTALLAAPYAPARAKTTTQAWSMAQLAAQEVQDTGYQVTYDTVDWQVPAGAWYYDGLSPLDALTRLAEASGAVVQSDPAELALRIRAGYPVSPWAWPATAPAAIVQDDIVLATSLQVRSVPQYDAVVVTGELQGKGVTTVVRRAGEGGTLFAPQASDQLINVAAAASERGRNILCDRGEQASIDHTLPLFPAGSPAGQTGRVLPLDLVEVREAEGTWQGLCTAISISARRDDKAVVVEQTITIERHYTDAN